MALTYARGWEILWNGLYWIYADNGETYNNQRVCKRCRRKPTPEGYDACQGHIKGMKSVCCGHGVTEPIEVKS